MLVKFLVQLFMPWRAGNWVARLSNTTCLMLMAASLGLIYTDKVRPFYFAALVIFMVMVLIVVIRDHRSFYRTLKQARRSRMALDVLQGRLRLEDLTPTEQEDVKIEFAYHREFKKPSS